MIGFPSLISGGFSLRRDAIISVACCRRAVGGFRLSWVCALVILGCEVCGWTIFAEEGSDLGTKVIGGWAKLGGDWIVRSALRDEFLFKWMRRPLNRMVGAHLRWVSPRELLSRNDLQLARLRSTTDFGVMKDAMLTMEMIEEDSSIDFKRKIDEQGGAEPSAFRSYDISMDFLDPVDCFKLGKAWKLPSSQWIPSIQDLAVDWWNRAALMEKCSKDWVLHPLLLCLSSWHSRLGGCFLGSSFSFVGTILVLCAVILVLVVLLDFFGFYSLLEFVYGLILF